MLKMTADSQNRGVMRSPKTDPQNSRHACQNGQTREQVSMCWRLEHARFVGIIHKYACEKMIRVWEAFNPSVTRIGK